MAAAAAAAAAASLPLAEEYNKMEIAMEIHQKETDIIN